ncbi:unnamed protein product [Rangifer tarandus platyrhynchus]|uniref:Uncharacterized protein n=1 Tax=Rangifer tarandus platyrhynchus TaxID=3082113 RepID=A0AC59Z890_RANTA
MMLLVDQEYMSVWCSCSMLFVQALPRGSESLHAQEAAAPASSATVVPFHSISVVPFHSISVTSRITQPGDGKCSAVCQGHGSPGRLPAFCWAAVIQVLSGRAGSCVVGFPQVMQEADTGSSLKLVRISVTQLTVGPTLMRMQL